jgi:hypothetical protein
MTMPIFRASGSLAACVEALDRFLEGERDRAILQAYANASSEEAADGVSMFIEYLETEHRRCLDEVRAAALKGQGKP